ncbi:hypothetical protein OPQ81_008328 [Rhizoctonia solani]|nr:hypothetical protein OPQ81_008328 [Rhizoctonia solani]
MTRENGPLTPSVSRANIRISLFSVSSVGVFTGHQNGSQRSHTGLKGSLRGIFSDVQCYGAFASYPNQVWPGGGNMSISAESIALDAKRITSWTGQFNRAFIGYHDIINASGKKKMSSESSAENIRRLLEKPRDLPTFIYVSGHTDSSGGERFYLPSDCVVNGSYDSSRVIPYSEFRDKLLLEHHQEPIILVTDFCNCNNIMELPYVYSYENGKVICATTEYYTGADWDSVDAVQFAATSPDQLGGFLFAWLHIQPRALHNVPLDKKLSLEKTVEHIQVRMDELLAPESKLYPSQNHRVYASRKFDGNDFFGALGFYFRPPPASHADNQQ